MQIDKNICLGCGCVFQCSDTTAQFCSKPCHYAYIDREQKKDEGKVRKKYVIGNRFREDKLCLVCGKEYISKAKNQKYCDLICSATAMKTQSASSLYYKFRFDVFHRDYFTCQYCGAAPSKDHTVKLHLEHRLPVSMDGETTVENVITACDKCNLGKGARYMPNVFLIDREISEEE